MVPCTQVEASLCFVDATFITKISPSLNSITSALRLSNPVLYLTFSSSIFLKIFCCIFVGDLQSWSSSTFVIQVPRYNFFFHVLILLFKLLKICCYCSYQSTTESCPFACADSIFLTVIFKVV